MALNNNGGLYDVSGVFVFFAKYHYLSRILGVNILDGGDDV